MTYRAPSDLIESGLCCFFQNKRFIFHKIKVCPVREPKEKRGHKNAESEKETFKMQKDAKEKPRRTYRAGGVNLSPMRRTQAPPLCVYELRYIQGQGGVEKRRRRLIFLN